MHFWIDKRSQGCGFRGPYLVPPSISASRRPRLMVTPVHRFQSIESVTPTGLRHPRAPGHHHPRVHHPRYPPAIHNAVGHPGRPSSRSINLLSNVQRRSGSVSRPPEQPTKKLKGSVWAFFAIIVFVLAIAKFYFNGVNMGMEALAFCSLLVVILIVGGLVSLYEALTTTAAHTAAAAAMEQIPEQEQSEELHQHVPSPTSVEPSPCELPPPPYHVAVNLPSHTRSSRESVRDSPPPSYDKAII